MAYTNIDDPSAHFQTALYTGNGSTQSITNDGNSDMQPDWVWIKSRSNASWHSLQDSSRGATKTLFSNTTNAEVTYTNAQTSFDSDGFSLAADSSGGSVNVNSRTYVGWQWKANGGTTASNSNGSITSTVQANTDAGFSIITYTGNGTQSGQTVGHGLGAVPKVIISKDRNASSNVPHWRVYHESIGNTKYLTLQGTDAASTFNDWDNTTPTSSVYSVGGAGGYTPTNNNNTPYVAYVFAEKQGYSKFGKYVGNGNANGPFIYTGFKPAFVMTKRTDTTSGWFIQDIKRGIRNSNSGTALEANTNLAESGIGATNYDIDFLSNGFKLRQSNAYLNASGGTYIYMAFAENPFTTSTGIPTTAR